MDKFISMYFNKIRRNFNRNMGKQYNCIFLCVCLASMFIIYTTVLSKDKTNDNSSKIKENIVDITETVGVVKQVPVTVTDQEKVLRKQIVKFNPQMQRMRCVDTIKTECHPYLKEWFHRLLKRQAHANDPELVRFTRDLIDPPSNHVVRKLPWGSRQTPQAEIIDNLLKQKTGGFFVEAGAQDGERASNTVWLETDRKWSGLLVEIDPWFYTQMRSKLRHSYTINAGLSPYSYITELELQESGGGLGKLLKSSQTQKQADNYTVITIPCIPVETLLLALNQTTVDYFSLDVEGFENDVIRTIPYSKFDIKTWSIEYSHTNALEMKDFMVKNGYNFVKQVNKYDTKISLVVEDYIFEKRKKNV